MSFAIVAEFPLGTFRGHVGEGELDLWPSPARLHAAFLAAAGQGARAVESEGALVPDAGALDALAWLEENPPDGLALPLHRVNPATNAVYRDIGALRPRMAGTKRILKRDNACIALGASVMWIWESGPPQAVAQVLEDLCPDVPYLGQSSSPVRLRLETTAASGATHRREPRASLSTSRTSDLDLSTPRRGRTTALTEAHRARSTAAPPRGAADRPKADEDDQRSPVVSTAVRRERYVPVGAPTAAPTPWPGVWVLPIADDPHRPDGIRSVDRVRWSVALHRSMIALHGDGAPGVLTGRYADDVRLPANRVAIQVVDSDPAMTSPMPTRQAFVVAVPAGADPGDVEAVARSVSTLKTVRSHGGAWVRIEQEPGGPPLLDGSRFWAPPSPGHLRRWTTTPAVADVRPPRPGPWSMADTAMLSVALTWRDTVDSHATDRLARDQRFRALARAARDHGVEVYDVRRVTTRPERYVHRVSDGFVVQPYVAVLSLGDLAPGGRAWSAIGQSRHLGGGLLLPTDISPAMLEVWGQR